jgi:hypothetical protein
MRSLVTFFIAMLLCGPALCPAAAQVSNRAQVTAATADALTALERDVLAAAVTPDMTVAQFVEKTHSHQEFARTLRGAEQIGGPRWLDDKTCQVRLELPGADVADALVAIAAAHPREAGIPADVLRDRVDRLREMTFAATGVSTCASERLRPPAGQVAWHAVSEDGVRAAVKEARRNAANRVLDELRSTDPRLDKILAEEKIRGQLESWLMSRPVTSVDFQDDLQVRVAVAVGGEALWDEFVRAAGDQKDAAVALRQAVVRKIEATTTGRAVAKADGGGAANVHAMNVAIPREPPRWVFEQVDARGSSRAVNGRLKTARAAERAAREKLRGRIEALSLSRNLTLGEAAIRDTRVRDAIDRAVERARPRKISYLADGGAEVTFSYELRDLWYDLEPQ